MKISPRNIIAIILLVIAIVVFRSSILESKLGLSTSSVQFILAPLIFLALLFASFGKIKLPVLPVLLSAVITLLSAFSNFEFISVNQDTFRVYSSPFISDRSESQSVKFISLLEKSLEKIDLKLKLERSINPLNSSELLAEFIENKLATVPDEAILVLAGSPRWLTLNVSPKFSKHLETESLATLLDALKLSIVTEVSGIGVSDAFSASSQEYLANVISAFSNLNSDRLSEAENDLLNASGVIGRWTGTSHRAYSLWLLGTLYLNMAVNDQGIEHAYLSCAIDYLTRARKFIRNNRDPEMLAAILNNRAIAHFLAYLFQGKKHFRMQALKEFRFASKQYFQSYGVYKRPAWLLAKENLIALNLHKKAKNKAKKVAINKKKQLQKSKIVKKRK